MRVFLLLIVVFSSLVALAEVVTEVVDCGWDAKQSASIRGGWIKIHKGVDEQVHEINLAISRGIGNRPYYRLQIVEMENDGIVTWPDDSLGKSGVEGRRTIPG